MPAFTYHLDASNTNVFKIHEYTQGPEWLGTMDQGIHLARKLVFDGEILFQHNLESKEGDKIALDGLIHLPMCSLVRSNGHLSGSIEGSYTMVDSKIDEEIVSVFFKWHLGVRVIVESIAFQHSEEAHDVYFRGIKFTQQRKLDFVMQDFEFYTPKSMSLLLMESGYSRVIDFVPLPVVVETDWDM